MIRRLSILALVALSMVVFASIASAVTVSAPHHIYATESGHFLANLRVIAGDDDSVRIEAEHLIGLENCTEDRFRTRDCMSVPAGEEYFFIYEGNLDDAEADGSVEIGVHFCDGQETFTAVIEIRNFGTVATEAGSWDTLKAQYR